MTIWLDGEPLKPNRPTPAEPNNQAPQSERAAARPADGQRAGVGVGGAAEGWAGASAGSPASGNGAASAGGSLGGGGGAEGGGTGKAKGKSKAKAKAKAKGGGAGAGGDGGGDEKEGGRLKPTQNTLRKLYLLSGNLCAFPDCNHIMLNAHGIFIGQVAHIEAAEELGPRYNKDMTDEQRRHISNLMLMCYPHHREIDVNKSKYDADTLRQFKQMHEKQFSQGGRLISVALRDRTKSDHVTYPKTLARIDWARGWNLTEDQREARIAELTDYVERFRKTPFELRRFFGAVVERRHYMRKSGVVERERVIRAEDICLSFDMPFEEVEQYISSLDAYGLAGFQDIWEHRHSLRRHIGIAIHPTAEGWHLWEDVCHFCHRAGVPLRAFIEDLDFEVLDDLSPPAPAPARERKA